MVLSLAVEFGSEREWSLIGGLMVQLHAFEREDEPRPTADIDLLGGARRPPRMTESMASLLVERGAGEQALHRTEVVLVSLDGAGPVAVRRPNLLGAILIKARVVVKKRAVKYESDREDMVRLLSYIDDPRPLVADMSRKEPRWLRDAEAATDFDDPVLSAQFPVERLGRARQALRLLTQESYSASSTK